MQQSSGAAETEPPTEAAPDAATPGAAPAGAPSAPAAPVKPLGTDEETIVFRVRAIDALQQQSRIEDQVPELANFATFDCEWHKENQDIYCFCLTDTACQTETLHINRFGGDRQLFMAAILGTMGWYDMLVGYYIFGDRDIDTDLKHLEINCIIIILYNCCRIYCCVWFCCGFATGNWKKGNAPLLRA